MAISRQLHWSYAFLALAVGAALAELLSLGLHPLLLGRGFSIHAFAEDRQVAQQEAIHNNVPADRPHTFLKEDALHPYLGFVGNPDLDAGFTNLGFWGSLGWPLPTRGSDKVLVGITGGSFASDLYGFGGESLRLGLSRVPRFRDRRIVLVNMAHGGWKQPQQLLALSWVLALGGELDVLINIDGFNEVALDGAENTQRGVFTAYPRAWASRVDDFLDSDQTALLAAVAWRADLRSAVASFFDRAVLRWSPTANSSGD